MTWFVKYIRHLFSRGTTDIPLFSRTCQTVIDADGLVEIRSCENTRHSSWVFQFVYHRNDGWVGSFCGNGGRCAGKFAVQLGLASADEGVTFCASDGEHLDRLERKSDLVYLKAT